MIKLLSVCLVLYAVNLSAGDLGILDQIIRGQVEKRTVMDEPHDDPTDNEIVRSLTQQRVRKFVVDTEESDGN